MSDQNYYKSLDDLLFNINHYSQTKSYNQEVTCETYRLPIIKAIENLKKYNPMITATLENYLELYEKFSEILINGISSYARYMINVYSKLIIENKDRFNTNPKDELIEIIDAQIVYIKLFYTHLFSREFSGEFSIFCIDNENKIDSHSQQSFIKIFNYLVKENVFGNTFLSNIDLFINNLNHSIVYMFQKESHLFNNLFNNLPSTISFEGVDATGKGTFSRGLEYIVNAVNLAATNGNCGYAQRINVPDYSTYYGKNIKNRLETSKDITSDIELDNTIYTFALNRREILNSLQSTNNTGKIKRNNIIFDRQTTSSCAFTCGKYLTQNNKVILLNSFTTNLKEIIFSLVSERIGNSNVLTLFDIFKYLQKIYYTEFTVLKNIKPDFEVFCFSDIDTIQARIENRRKTTNSETNKDNDVHKKDAHEDNINILQNTNSIYVFIYNITKAYKKMAEKCQRMNYTKKDINNILWYETTKVLEEYIEEYLEEHIEEFSGMIKQETFEEYIKQIDSFRDLFEYWFNYQETIAIYNEFEEYDEEKHMLSYTEKSIYNVIKYMNHVHCINHPKRIK